MFDAAKECGPYDEMPVLVDGRDPQVHVSRNDRPQPFFLICSADTVLAQVSGTATLDLELSPVRYHRLEPGDLVYLPAGTASRIRPEETSIHVRYKAAPCGTRSRGLVLLVVWRRGAPRRVRHRGGAAAGRLLARVQRVQRRRRAPTLWGVRHCARCRSTSTASAGPKSQTPSGTRDQRGNDDWQAERRAPRWLGAAARRRVRVPRVCGAPR